MTISAARYFHLSNLVTYVSLLAGLLAIVSAKEFGSLSAAGGLIALCALADTLDGKFAQLFERTESQKQFGVQLDSLTDSFTFGLAPVVSFYFVVPIESLTARSIWLAAGFFYLLSAITRLGYYNIHRSEGSGFIGLPTTISGLIWSSSLLAQPSVALSVWLLLGCGVAMVSLIPIPRPRFVGTAIILAWAVILIVLHGASIYANLRPAFG
jgi:CDP-diacylglycerol--serine O-phosphatidyltransferase